MSTTPCPTPRCGQPVPADAQPWERCLACGKPVKTKQLENSLTSQQKLENSLTRQQKLEVSRAPVR